MKNTRLSLMLAAILCTCSQLVAQTDLYRRYADRDDIKVASVSGFRIDSTSQADVTLIEAIDDSGWQWMKSEFHIGELSEGQAESLRDGNDIVFFARRSRSNPSESAPVVGERVDASASCYMGISYLQRAVYIFCADSEEQNDAIVALLVKKIMHTSQ